MPISPLTFSDVFCCCEFEFVFCVCSRTSCMVGSRWKLWPISGTRRSDRAHLVLRTLKTRMSYSEPNTHAPECWWMGRKMNRACVLDSERMKGQETAERNACGGKPLVSVSSLHVSPVCSWPLMTNSILCGRHHSADPPPSSHHYHSSTLEHTIWFEPIQNAVSVMSDKPGETGNWRSHMNLPLYHVMILKLFWQWGFSICQHVPPQLYTVTTDKVHGTLSRG